MRHKRSTPNRGNRVSDQIQRDVAELIRDLKDPRIGMVTLNAVEVTPDYAHAKIYFSVLVGDSQACETALNEAAGFLRYWRRRSESRWRSWCASAQRIAPRARRSSPQAPRPATAHAAGPRGSWLE